MTDVYKYLHVKCIYNSYKHQIMVIGTNKT